MVTGLLFAHLIITFAGFPSFVAFLAKTTPFFTVTPPEAFHLSFIHFLSI
jgi:hypothetical protein